MEKFIEWIKQPSTVKAIIGFASLFGCILDPEHIKEIVGTATGLYMAIAAFWQKS